MVRPAVEVGEGGGPLLGVILGHDGKVVGDVADLLPEEEGDVGGRGFDIDTVSFELFDAFGDELVVVYERPQVSEEERERAIMVRAV